MLLIDKPCGKRRQLSVILSLFVVAAWLRLPAYGQHGSPALEKAAAACRRSQTLSGDILLTWRTGGVVHQTRGTIQLARPNRGRIALQGDYPQVLLVSDGKTRTLAASEDKFQQAPIDATGAGLDSPWWGLPFRFFFTQSVNPFGSSPDTSATYSEVETRNASDARSSRVSVQGNSPMGAYTETLVFNAAGDLLESSIQFGQGPGAALFRASLSNVRHGRVSAAVFRFVPRAGTAATSSTDGMLPIGAAAPAFTLPAPDGQTTSLRQELKGKKVLLVNFWYYNCAPCRVEFPELEKLYKQFAAQGFTMVAIDKGDSPDVVARYARDAGLTFPILLGGGLGKGSVFDTYKVGEAFPSSYLLDEKGRVVFRSNGADIEGLRQALGALGFH